MKKIIFSLLLFFSVALCAQEKDAALLLEKAIKNIEADAAVQMTFSYSVFDADSAEQYADTGSLKLDGNSYSLLLSPMKLWCDGKTQWSYMEQTNEVYITEADSDEAQVYNPVYLMGLYKKGYDCSLKRTGEADVITLVAADAEQSFDKVVLSLDMKNMRPISMLIYMAGGGYTKVNVTSYKPGCNFDKRVYRCPVEDFPTAEIVDMR